MRTETIRSITAILWPLFLAATLCVPLLAHARPYGNGLPQLNQQPSSMDVWFRGQHEQYSIPAHGLDLGEGDLITGDIQYEDLSDYFGEADVEVVDDDLIVFELPDGNSAELVRIGSSDWWGLWGYECTWAGDMGSCQWSYLATITTDGFDLAAEFRTSLILHGEPGEVAAVGAAGATIVIGICVTIIAVVITCAAVDMELSASAGPYTATLSC